MEEEINLQNYIEVILKRLYLIVVLAVIMGLVMGLPTISKRDAFETRAALLLKDGGGAQNQLAGLQSLMGIKASANNGVANFTILLNSRAVAEGVMEDLKLTRRIVGWDDPKINKQNLISSTQSMVKFTNKDGLFIIKAITDDPVLAADMANSYAKAGSELWNKLNYTEARKKREYIESQLPRVEKDLIKSENDVKRFSLISPTDDLLRGIDYERLKREYEIQNETYKMLRKEYESVKLEESKEVDPFSMIDPALTPLNPIPKKVVFNTIIGLFLGSFAGMIIVFILEKDKLFNKK